MHRYRNMLIVSSWFIKWKVSEINIGKPDELPERQKALREFCLYLKRQFLRKKYKNMKFCYVKSLYFRYISKRKKFRTKILDLGTFLYGIHRFGTIYTKLTLNLC